MQMWVNFYRNSTHAGSCVIGLIDNKKPALGGLERAQALRNLLIPTSDSSPAMMPSSHSGLVGTGVAGGAAAGVAVTLPVGPVSGVKVRNGAFHPVAP